MIVLTCITFLAILIQISFATVALAAGLYYVAELVEEYTVTAKKTIFWTNTIVTVLYILLWLFENFPWHMIIGGLSAQLCHFFILTNFPYVSFLSPAFLIGVIFLVINHYLAFQYFGNGLHTFSQVMAYFTVFQWLVPFSLFVSLSMNDYVLPTTTDRFDNSDVVSNYFSKRNKKYGLLTFFNYAKESLLPLRTKKGF